MEIPLRLDPKAAELLAARAALLPRTGTVPAQTMRDLHKTLHSKQPPGPAVSHVRDEVWPGPAGDIPVRCYRPTENVPALVVYFHGGGWTVGSLAGWDSALRRLALGSGCAIVSVDYRLAPEYPFPAGLEDALAAVRWAAEHAEAIAGKDVPLIVAGDSAGANLSTVVARLLRDQGGPALAAQVLLYPCTDGDVDHERLLRFVPPTLTREEIGWYFDQVMPDRSQRLDPRFAPLRAEDLSRMPPTFVGTVDTDLLREEGELYARRLREAGVQVQTQVYRGTFHGFFTGDRGLMPHSGQLIDDLSAFVASILTSCSST